MMNNQFKMITPSASPAPIYRKSDGPSPSKRPRLTSNSTPSGSSSSISTPPAFSNQTYHTTNRNPNPDGTELHDARRASSFRVLNVWSQLAERYSRPLAEDDIVDLRTGDIVKDRNVIRSTPHQYDIGFFGDLDGGTETPTTDEGSDDELDAFAPGADISDELEMERVSREGLVPVREMDPADAEDLREFLEAENRRKEMFGSEGEEEQSREDEEGEGEGDSEVVLPGVEVTEGSTDEIEGGLVENEQWPGDPEPNPNIEQEPELELDSDEKDDITYTVPLKDPDSGSDDELGIWDEQDEGSTVYAIAGDLDSDDLVEGERVVEIPFPETPPPRGRGRPQKSSQIPGRSSPGRSKSMSKLKRNMSPPIVQLHTPPQSTSSATGTTPDTFALALPTSTADSSPPSRQAKLKSTTISGGKSLTKFDDETLETNPSPSKMPRTTTPAKPTPKPGKSTPKPTPKPKETPSKKPKWMPEVVIMRRASNSANTTPVKPGPRTRAVSQSVSRPDVLVSDDGESARSTDKGHDERKSKGKGKSRAPSTPEPSPRPSVSIASQDEDESQSDDPMALVSSPDQHPRRTPATDLSASESERDRFSTPLSNPSTPYRGRGRGRKRKRVLSSSVEADPDQPEEEGNDLGMGLPIISPDIDLIDFSRRNYDAYGLGQESPVSASKSTSRSRGKRRSSLRASSSRIADADSAEPEPPSPLQITKRSSPKSRARLFPSSNHNSASPNAYHYPYSEIYTPRHTPNYIPNHEHNHHHAASVPPPQQQYPSMPSMQGPQAQFLLAQAMHHLSYLMNASGHASHPHPHSNVGQPSWPQPPAAGPGPSSSYVPPPFNSHSADWAPYTTPTRPRHQQRSNVPDSSPIASSSSASISASAYMTPVHPHPYPYAFTPSPSIATLPPSSPDQAKSSSSYTSLGDIETTRSKSLLRGRSKSRGRRVSFRIDDDRPHGLNEHERGQRLGLPLRFEEDDDDDVVELKSSSPSKPVSSNRSRSMSVRRESSSGAAVRRSPTPRSKGKAKAIVAIMDATGDESDSDGSPSQAHSKQRVGWRYERAQTPGPPSTAGRSRSILKHEKRS